MVLPALERFDLEADRLPNRWYNVIPDLPRAPEDFVDPATSRPVDSAYIDRRLVPALAAQDRSMERWVSIPPEVLAQYRVWRPTPLYRAHALESELDTPARIYFKFEGGSPSGSHKLNSALAQAHYAKRAGIKRLITDTGAGQWGSALAIAGALTGLEVVVYMIRSSYERKPDRRNLMETMGAKVLPSPSEHTAVGRQILAADPGTPGSEGIAASEALEAVLANPDSRFSMGAFANHVLLHQSVIGLETRAVLEDLGEEPDHLIASVGCGSNLGGFAFPWVADRRAGADIKILAAEPDACPTLSRGEYRYDYADATGQGPLVRTMTLGHEFVPPAIHAGGLRYHGAAPLVGMLSHEGLIDAVAYRQREVFAAGAMFARLTGLVPAPETAHAIRAVIDVALRCKSERRASTIVFCYSGHGLLDLGAYERWNHGLLEDVEDLDQLAAETKVTS